MDVLQEVNQSKKIIDDLLFQLFSFQDDDYSPIQDELPDIEFKRLMYAVSTYQKLAKDDDYSLSEKGVVTFRKESQSLLYFLRIKLKEKEDKAKLAVNGSRLFSYKINLLNWDKKVKWPVAILHGMFFVIGLVLISLLTFFAYFRTDENNIIIVSIIIYLIFMATSIPDLLISALDGEKVSKRFRIGNAALLLWRTLVHHIPLIVIGFGLYKYNHYWQDDIIVMLFISFPISLLLSSEAADGWFSQLSELKTNTPDGVAGE
jgi:hypothetical protein